MFNIGELVPRLRRFIGDTGEESRQYSDEILQEYLEDSVYNILTLWNHDYYIDEEGNFNEEPEEIEKTIFLIQAKVDILSKNRDISFTSGALSVTHKGDDKEYLQERLKKAIRLMKLGKTGLGKSSTEHDLYKNRLDEWVDKLIP